MEQISQKLMQCIYLVNKALFYLVHLLKRYNPSLKFFLGYLAKILHLYHPSLTPASRGFSFQIILIYTILDMELDGDGN